MQRITSASIVGETPGRSIDGLGGVARCISISSAAGVRATKASRPVSIS